MYRPTLLAALVLASSLLLAPKPACADAGDACATTAETAQSMMRAHRLVEARAELLLCAKDACPAVVRRDCADWLADVDSRTPSIVVRATDARGQDVIGARVLLDGTLVSSRLDGTPVMLDPGRHRLRVEARGASPVERDLLVAEGERSRFVPMVFAVPLTADGENDALVAPRASPGPRRSGEVVAAYVLGAVGVAALGAFAILDATAYSDYRTLSNACGQTGSCAGSDVSALRTRFTLAAVSLGVGVAAVGVASGLYLTAAPRAGGGTALLAGHF